MDQLAGRASSHSDTAMHRPSKAGGSELKAEPRRYSSNRLSTTTLKGPEALARLGVDVEQPPAAETPSHAHRAFQWVSNLDRGAGYYSQERERHKRPSLVETGRKAGDSRVDFLHNYELVFHEWRRDFFISALNTSMSRLMAVISLSYIAMWLFFGLIWWFVHLGDPTCLSGPQGTYGNILIFAIATQQTIGYGNTAPNDCWGGIVVIAIQTILGIFLDAVVLGIIFSRLSHPKNRGRTIAISDSAVICRRDGILKFMFRIADFRSTQVVEPKVTAWLYSWGEGRVTAEGEHIPCRIEELEIGYIDGMMLLPIIVEHTIDEQSPLCGQNHDSLMHQGTEIIITFEGTTEMGNPFMVRQSYLPHELHWGHTFQSIIGVPPKGETRYTVDMTRFHEVEPLEGLEMMGPSALSTTVVNRALRTVPYPLLGENTLVLSDTCILAPDDEGNMALMFRVGDTYPTQHLDVSVRAYIYRWQPSRKPSACGIPNDYSVQQLEVGYESGADRLVMWLPVVVRHVITPDSPLASWLQPGGTMADADSCILVVVEGYQYKASQNRMRMRIFNVLQDVKAQHAFQPIVSRPAASPGFKPRINWTAFHDTIPLAEAASLYRQSAVPKTLPGATSDGVGGLPGVKPHIKSERTMRHLPLDNVPKHLDTLTPKAAGVRTMPPEMHQIMLHTDPTSHFHTRSMLTQRPRANFDAISEHENGNSTGHSQSSP